MNLHLKVHPGRAPTVVLVHGSMDRGAAFAKVSARLDHRAIRYDRRGYGRSPLDGAAVDVQGHADDLLALIDEHAGGAAVVIGHSLGGVVALTAAGRRTGAVLAVGAYESPMPWLPWWPESTAGGAAMRGEEPGAAAEAFLRRMLGNRRWEATPPAQQATRRVEGVALVAELRSLRGSVAPYDLAAIDVPVAAACGSLSRPHHRRAAAEVSGGSPTVIEGAHHGAHVSHPDEFAAWVTSVAALVPSRED